MKQNRLAIWYDKEGDFLEIRMPNGFKKTSFEEIGDSEIFNEVDEETGKCIGVAVFAFSKRFSPAKDLSIPLPFELKLIA